jgi:hypothetical protein
MERIRRHLSFANCAAGLALLFSMTGGAVAATGGFSSGGTLRACANEEGAIRLLKPGKKCKKGQTQVAWNQTGPAGAKGAPGASGATGATGTAGATGAAGAKGAEGAPAVSLWARITEAGEIDAGNGIVGVKKNASDYDVTFDRDISQCAAIATPSAGNASHYVGDVISAGEGTVSVVISTPSTVGVASSFNIAVYC